MMDEGRSMMDEGRSCRLPSQSYIFNDFTKNL